jgi:ADP-ribose pyrophosphatase YjhB (NUDIX family)
VTTTNDPITEAKPPRHLRRLGSDVIPVRTIAGRRCLLLATMGKGPHKGKRGTIGGHLEELDSFWTAGKREGKEEGNMVFDLADLIPILLSDDPDRDVRDDGTRGVGVAFLLDADKLDFEPVAGDDVSHVEWVPAEEIAEAIANGTETYAYDHHVALGLACEIVADPTLWPPKPRERRDEVPLLLFPIAQAAVERRG